MCRCETFQCRSKCLERRQNWKLREVQISNPDMFSVTQAFRRESSCSNCSSSSWSVIRDRTFHRIVYGRGSLISAFSWQLFVNLDSFNDDLP